MSTQKQTIYSLQTQAQPLDLAVSIRKNSYGEYELRVREAGTRRILLDYFADSFEDAAGTIKSVLADAQKEQAEYERSLDAQYARDLQVALDHAQSILSLVGCRIDVSPNTYGGDVVTMISPKTGTHSLCMKRGVRPVSDLLHHVCGFAEQQTHSR